MEQRILRALLATLALAAFTSEAALVRLAPLPPSQAKSVAGTTSDGALRIGVARMIPEDEARRAIDAMRWQRDSSGHWTATLTVHAEGAAALRLAIERLPRGARVVFRNATAAWPVAFEEHEAARRTHGAYWGPVLEGPEQALDVVAPVRPAPGELSLAGISQLAVTAAELVRSKAAQACHEDVACIRDPDPAFTRAARAVAKLVYTRDGATYACTGTLVAGEGAASPAPLLVTAKHCIGSAEVAATLNTFWSLEADGCGSKTHAPPVQLARGARLLYAGASSDVALLHLREPPPPSATFARLDDAVPAQGEPVLAIHHPRGEPKKVASGLVVAPGEGGGRVMSVAWLAGATEPGSSGSGLFTRRGGEWRLAGTLRGGSASCDTTGAVADPSNRDYYARLGVEREAIDAFLRAPALPQEDFTDMWQAVSEPGHGLSVVQHASGNVFAVWFAYDGAGNPTWLVVPGGRWLDGHRFEGDLHRASRSGGPLRVAPVGRARVRFAGDEAQLELSIDGVVREVLLARQSF